MLEKLENILIINSGGGFGDAVQHIPLFNFIGSNYPNLKIYYFGNDSKKFYFDNELKNLIPKNFITIKNFPKYFGFNYRDYFLAKKLIKSFNFNKFDLIIDNQTRIKNTLVFKKIPHKYYFSPCLMYFFSYPKVKLNKNRNIIGRVIDYFNFIEKKNIKLNYNISLQEKYLIEAKRILGDSNYIGFSVTAGHPSRTKEFNREELFKIIKHFKKNYIPIFFIKKEQKEMIDFIKSKFKDAFFPEHSSLINDKTPDLLIALSRMVKFNISIDNGIAHLLSLSNTKTFVFYPGNMEKFKPERENFFGYNCKDYKDMSILKSDKIIDFIETNL